MKVESVSTGSNNRLNYWVLEAWLLYVRCRDLDLRYAIGCSMVPFLTRIPIFDGECS